MKKAILGKKLGMTQIFDNNGLVVPVTVVEAGPCYVTQVKNKETDGYEAVQMAFGEIKAKNVNKCQTGAYKKAGVEPKRMMKEFKLDNSSEFALGQEIKCDVFAEGDKVDVSGVSKGHGFSGVIKRWNHSRLKETHGTGPVARHPGALGDIDPARVFKGMKGAGHLGAERVTVQNLEIVKIDVENNLIAIQGAIPGARKGIVIISDTVKKAEGGRKCRCLTYPFMI